MNSGDKKDTDKYEVLKQYFGYTTFKEGQEAIIDAILEGRDAVGIMPTGAGKSLCFQIPALMFEGITLVISPLISLMKDQVNALIQVGVKAAYLNSSLSADQFQRVRGKAMRGEYKIIYVAPERLLTEDVQKLAQNIPISMITVDEAHCVSQWGQDFRPSYLLIEKFIGTLSNRPVISAFTATATPEVRSDVIEFLKLNHPSVIFTGFNRENLYFEVQHPKDKMTSLLSVIRKNGSKSIIIYCATRKNVEEVCTNLCKESYKAARYHAGLSDLERKRNQEDFLFDRMQIMVATNAFGMGIDKSNISLVIHYNMPKDIESYYQEAGRAGRDGEAAECILFYSGQDVVTNQFLIDHGGENDLLEEELQHLLKEKERERLKQMTFYCHTNECLREYILRYFGEKSSKFCGNCYNCLHHSEELDITTDSQKILSCVKRSGQRYGVKTIIDTLRGSKTEKLMRLHLNEQSTYGIMKDTREPRLREMINFLILNEYLYITNDEYPVLRLGIREKEILIERKMLKMKVIKDNEVNVKANRKTTSKEGFGVNFANGELFDSLRELRSRIAQKQGVPAFVVFSNATLTDMCVRLPGNEEEMLEVNGVGKEKFKRYGKEFLEVINRRQTV
ncbi:MAG TPA: DNA helicase RecQ [Anaerovoracaceae bacterium]|nr:DNA helicase RecQ [Anaerovoracaceae bacterium]